MTLSIAVSLSNANPLLITIQKVTPAALPIMALASLDSVTWRGTLQNAPASGSILFLDLDLFDGTPAVVLANFAPPSTNDPLLANSTMILS